MSDDSFSSSVIACLATHCLKLDFLDSSKLKPALIRAWFSSNPPLSMQTVITWFSAASVSICFYFPLTFLAEFSIVQIFWNIYSVVSFWNSIKLCDLIKVIEAFFQQKNLSNDNTVLLLYLSLYLQFYLKDCQVNCKYRASFFLGIYISWSRTF